jgi:hypothetical protein
VIQRRFRWSLYRPECWTRCCEDSCWAFRRSASTTQTRRILRRVGVIVTTGAATIAVDKVYQRVADLVWDISVEPHPIELVTRVNTGNKAVQHGHNREKPGRIRSILADLHTCSSPGGMSHSGDDAGDWTTTGTGS